MIAIPSSQNGFSIVSAIFVVVILSLIGSYMVSISALTQTSANLTIQEIKAYYAAKSGLEWAIYKVAPSSASGGAPPYQCPTSPTTLSFAQGGFNGFTVVVTCIESTFSERGATYKVFSLLAAAQYGVPASDGYVSRQLYTTVIQPGI